MKAQPALEWTKEELAARSPEYKRAKAIELRLQGATYAEIAPLLGCTRQGAQKLCRPRFQLRDLLTIRANGCCESCRKPTPKGHAHHISVQGKTPETFNKLDNLQYLCIACHGLAHRKLE
jgi:hypothetical protein